MLVKLKRFRSNRRRLGQGSKRARQQVGVEGGDNESEGEGVERGVGVGGGEEREWTTLGRGLGQHQTVYAAQLVSSHLTLASTPLLPTLVLTSHAKSLFLWTTRPLLAYPVEEPSQWVSFSTPPRPTADATQDYQDNSMSRETNGPPAWKEAKGGTEAEEQLQEIRELAETAERAGKEAMRPNGPSDKVVRRTEASRETKERERQEEPIFAKSCWGLEGLRKATTALRAQGRL